MKLFLGDIHTYRIKMKLFLDDTRDAPDKPGFWLNAAERAELPPSEYAVARTAQEALDLIAAAPMFESWSVDFDLGHSPSGLWFLHQAAEYHADKWPRGHVTTHSTHRHAYELRNFIRVHEDGDAAVLEPDPITARNMPEGVVLTMEFRSFKVPTPDRLLDNKQHIWGDVLKRKHGEHGTKVILKPKNKKRK